MAFESSAFCKCYALEYAGFKHYLKAGMKEKQLKRALDTSSIRRLPTALTAPPPRPREMPVQEIVVWTPGKALVAMFRTFGELWGVAVRDSRVPRRT